MATSLSKADMQSAIFDYVQKKVATEFDITKEKMVKDFAQTLEDKRAEIVAGVAMRLTKIYQIESAQDRIIITVEDRRK